jgi:hypothetical protein
MSLAKNKKPIQSNSLFDDITFRLSAPPITAVAPLPRMQFREPKKFIPFTNAFLDAHAHTLAAAGPYPLAFDHTWLATHSARGAAATHDPVAIDVEIYSNLFLVCAKRLTDGAKAVFELSDRTDASTFDRHALHALLRASTIVTFNGMTYDLPLIWLALNKATNEQLKAASDRIIKGGLKYWNVESALGIRIPKQLDHIDLLEANPSVRQGLKVIAGRLHARYMVDLPFEPETRLTPEQMNIVTLYCFNDLDATELMFNALKEPLELRRALSEQYKIDMRSKSDAQIGEAIVKRKVEAALGRRIDKNDAGTFHNGFGYEVPSFIRFTDARMNEVLRDLSTARFTVDESGKVNTPEWLEALTVTLGTAGGGGDSGTGTAASYSMGIGGLHSMEQHRAVHADTDHALIDLDVASQYPNIILKLGLYPKAMGSAFLRVYADIVKERLAAKQEQKRIEERIAELEKQLALLESENAK